MSSFAVVRDAYARAWAHRTLFVSTYLILRLVAYAILIPAVGALVNLAVSLSNQSALTDQDIAGFILTPAGFVVFVVILSLLLVVEVLGFAIMTAIWRARGMDRRTVARTALRQILNRLAAVVTFAVHFVLRILMLVLPFVLVGLVIAARYLTEYDINYYLSDRPPEAMMAMAAIAGLFLAAAVVVLMRLSSWAVALHLVIFDNCQAKAAFSQSALRMTGQKFRLQRELIVWLVVRFVMMALLGLIAGGFLRLMPVNQMAGLRFVLTMSMAIAVLWALLRLMVAGISLGALARIVNGVYGDDVTLEPVPESRVIPTLSGNLTAISAITVGLIIAGFWTGAKLLDAVKTEDRVEIIAHRGAAGTRPENTIIAVQTAIDDGADWVEIDVQETADGQVVVLHDSDFMKLAGIDLKIWDATMDELSEIDIGGWFDPAYSNQRTPLLRDVLQAAKGRARVLIELKYYGHDVDLEARVAHLVEEMDMSDQIATMSLKYPAVQKMAKLRPDWRTGVLAATAVGNLAGLEGEFVAVNSGQANSRLVRDIGAAGKDLYVWTVNEPLEMSKMISMGVNGVITDEPGLLRQVLEIRAQMNTAERLVLWLSQELGLELNSKEYRDGAP